MSSRAPIGYLAIAEMPIATNQGFIAMKAAAGVSNLFLLRWAEWAHDVIASRANGSTFQEISKANFRPIKMSRRPRRFSRRSTALLARYTPEWFATSRYDRIGKGSRYPAPKLISGELRLPDAERFAESDQLRRKAATVPEATPAT